MGDNRIGKERTSVAGWWFRFLDDETGTVPGTWGEELRVAQVREKKGKRIIAINYQTKEERLYLTTTAAAKALGLSQSSVSEVARGDMRSAGGWWFKFEDDTRNMPESFGTSAAREKRDRTVYGVHLETGERRTFRNCTVAANELGLYGTAAAAVAGGGLCHPRPRSRCGPPRAAVRRGFRTPKRLQKVTLSMLSTLTTPTTKRRDIDRGRRKAPGRPARHGIRGRADDVVRRLAGAGRGADRAGGSGEEQ